MTVTDIERGQKNIRRYNIYLNGVYSFSVYDDTLLEFHIKKGMSLSLPDIEEITLYDKKKIASSKAYELLSHRAFSKKGLIKRLMEKGIESDDAHVAAEELEKDGYIDDSEYSKEFAKYYCEVKGFGKRRIVSELILKGVDREAAEEAAEICSEYDNIEKELKKMAKNKDLSDTKEKRKVTDRLIRKGYDYESIRDALRRLSDDEELW